MKIFNRGTDAKAAGPAAASAVVPPAAPAPVAAPVAAPTSASAPAAPPAPPAPDLAVILDANVKEMSEKIARLASSLESTSQERGSFEAKLEQMEERMRKLSSLTEMISAQYNPFVGDAPSEREALPAAEVGLAPPAMPAAALPPLPEPPAPLAAPAPGPTLGLTLEPPAPPAPTADPFASLPPFEAPAAPPPADVAPTAAPALFEAPEAAAPVPAAEPGVYLWSIPAGFESSMILLGWADMLLKTAGSREALLDIANYYHNIGWIGDPARDQLLAYADGLATPTGPAPVDWRASVETHEKSLMFVEKLRAVGRRSPG